MRRRSNIIDWRVASLDARTGEDLDYPFVYLHVESRRRWKTLEVQSTTDLLSPLVLPHLLVSPLRLYTRSLSSRTAPQPPATL